MFWSQQASRSLFQTPALLHILRIISGPHNLKWRLRLSFNLRNWSSLLLQILQMRNQMLCSPWRSVHYVLTECCTMHKEYSLYLIWNSKINFTYSLKIAVWKTEISLDEQQSDKWMKNITDVASWSEFNASIKYRVNSIKPACRQSGTLNKSQFLSPHEINSINVKWNCKFQQYNNNSKWNQ